MSSELDPNAATVTAHAPIAQQVEQLPCKQQVIGSSPIGSTRTCRCGPCVIGSRVCGSTRQNFHSAWPLQPTDLQYRKLLPRKRLPCTGEHVCASTWLPRYARMVKQVYTGDLKSPGVIRVGSSPTSSTIFMHTGNRGLFCPSSSRRSSVHKDGNHSFHLLKRDKAKRRDRSLRLPSL